MLSDENVAEDLVMTVTPGSRQILDSIAQTGVYSDLVRAGARMLEPVCGPCVGMGQAPPSEAVSVRTFNRNFPGRSGTQTDQVYLTTPDRSCGHGTPRRHHRPAGARGLPGPAGGPDEPGG